MADMYVQIGYSWYRLTLKADGAPVPPSQELAEGFEDFFNALVKRPFEGAEKILLDFNENHHVTQLTFHQKRHLPATYLSGQDLEDLAVSAHVNKTKEVREAINHLGDVLQQIAPVHSPPKPHWTPPPTPPHTHMPSPSPFASPPTSPPTSPALSPRSPPTSPVSPARATFTQVPRERGPANVAAMQEFALCQHDWIPSKNAFEALGKQHGEREKDVRNALSTYVTEDRDHPKLAFHTLRTYCEKRRLRPSLEGGTLHPIVPLRPGMFEEEQNKILWALEKDEPPLDPNTQDLIRKCLGLCIREGSHPERFSPSDIAELYASYLHSPVIVKGESAKESRIYWPDPARQPETIGREECLFIFVDKEGNTASLNRHAAGVDGEGLTPFPPYPANALRLDAYIDDTVAKGASSAAESFHRALLRQYSAKEGAHKSAREVAHIDVRKHTSFFLQELVRKAKKREIFFSDQEHWLLSALLKEFGQVDTKPELWKDVCKVLKTHKRDPRYETILIDTPQVFIQYIQQNRAITLLQFFADFVKEDGVFLSSSFFIAALLSCRKIHEMERLQLAIIEEDIEEGEVTGNHKLNAFYPKDEAIDPSQVMVIYDRGVEKGVHHYLPVLSPVIPRPARDAYLAKLSSILSPS